MFSVFSVNPKPLKPGVHLPMTHLNRVRYSKTCEKRPLKINKTMILMTNGSLMKYESIAECSTWSILQYFWSAFSGNRYWKPILGLFGSGRFKHGLLYLNNVGFSISGGPIYQYILGQIYGEMVQWCKQMKVI